MTLKKLIGVGLAGLAALAVAVLLIDPSLRMRMGDAARRNVETRWPLDRTVERWRELYRDSRLRLGARPC